MIRPATTTAQGKRKRHTVRRTMPERATVDSGTRMIAGETTPEESAVERHEAIWLDGRVPNGYWDQPSNRRLYVRWLGQQLGFRGPQDWYRISTNDFKQHAGGGVLHRWHDSAVYAVQESCRDQKWKEWLFKIAPRHFWQDPKNHQMYMQWLGERLGIRDPSDWYRVTNQDFRDHGGGAFLLHYDSTVSAAIKAYLPDYDWKDWMFAKTPKGFWHQRKNRQRYMLWLGTTLGFQKPEDWYTVTGDDFNSNYGNQLLKLYGGSPLAALRDCFPRHTWHEWKFARVPFGFWDDPNNRRRYVSWLGEKLKVRSPQDWHKVRRRDLLVNYGGGLLAMYHSHWDLLAECVPGLEREVGKSTAEVSAQP
jgi:hypothetical protein